MEFRYQEILSWIIPGFFFIACVIIFVLIGYDLSIDDVPTFVRQCFWTQNCHGDYSFDSDMADSFAVLLVFLIPILSLIVGWILNFCGGCLLKWNWLQGHSIVKGYKAWKNEKNKKNKTDNSQDILNRFERAKHEIDLDEIDRFYYRYVFSRNMFTAQIILTLVWTVLRLSGQTLSCYIGVWVFVVMIVLDILFYFIMSRDLTTHACFVFVTKERLKNKKEADKE